jgi:hypothetical protein|nr:MAG TPA: hypothetical protein [Caudoviricetes sp.]
MAIQDLINEVNSIQTKKQAIKEAITSKGVTSEGKLSKFADEIKKISSSEPYWYMINRIRHDNGNEGVCIRTNNFNRAVDRITQLTSQGGGRYQSGSSYTRAIAESNFTMITADEKSVAKPCRMITTRKDDNIDFGLSKDNFSIDFNNYNVSFKNIASKSFSKDFKQSYLINNSALLIRCTTVLKNGVYNPISKVENLLGSSTNAKDYTIKMTGSNAYDSNVKLTPIDSATFLKAASYRETTITGSFYEVGSRRSGSFRLVPTYGYNDYQRAFANTTLDYGHYMFLECSSLDINIKIVFVGISEALDQDSNANKVVEVYTYTNKRVYQGIYDDTVTLEDSSGINFYIGETYDLYINFSDNGQKYLLNNLKNDSYASSKDGKTIDTIKSIYNSNFMSGKDALIEFNAKKAPAGQTNPSQALNLFKKVQASGSNRVSYNDTNYRACPVDTILSKSMSNNSITGFIRLNDNSSTMFPITLEKATNEIKSNSSLNFNNFKVGNAIAIAPNGIPNKNNRMIIFVNTYENNTNNIECFYIKKGNDYITNDWLSSSENKTQLYISTDGVSQTYIKNKPLTDIWTEINNLPKETYSTYNN